MKLFKYCCASLALLYLVNAFLPTHFTVAQHSRVEAITPEWAGRMISTAYFLFLGAISYGVQQRKPIYWRLIPVLLGIYLLGVFVPALWTFSQLHLPWLPFLFIGGVMFIAFLVFIAWWRNQRRYFAL
jgi:hypothetical protein